MKLSLAIATILSVTAFGDVWTPPDNPDPRRILNEARADAKAERFEEALAKHIWFHRNALKYRRSLYGVRLSYALRDWYDLGKAYPPALVKLQETRDEAIREVHEEATRNGTDREHLRGSFHNFVSINRTLDEESRTSEAFVRLHAENPATAKEIFDLAQPALVKDRKYELCGEYIDPKQDSPRMIERFRQGKQLAKDAGFGARHLDFVNRKFTNDAATLIGLLAVNGRQAEAEEVARDAKNEWDDMSFHKAIDDALQGNVPEPWP